MSSYYLAPTYNPPGNISSIPQASKANKSSATGSFEQALQVESLKESAKSNLNSKVKNKQSAIPLNAANSKVKEKVSQNYLALNQSSDINGTNLALKELSTELAEQMVGILFSYAMNQGGNLEGGFAETIYSQEANAEIVKDVARDLVDDLSNRFYEESSKDLISKVQEKSNNR